MEPLYFGVICNSMDCLSHATVNEYYGQIKITVYGIHMKAIQRLATAMVAIGVNSAMT